MAAGARLAASCKAVPLLLLFPLLAAAARPGAAARHSISRRPQWALLVAEAREGANSSTSLACQRSVQGHPSEINCPKDCPFLRAEPTQMCGFTCVAAGDCHDDDPLASFANPETMRCEGCKAVACSECRTAWKCAKCQEGFVLSRFDTCVSPYRGAWWLVYLILFLILGPIVYYIVMLPFRPTVNGHCLEKGLEFREEGKVLEPHTGLPYKLWRNLGNDYVSGIGLMLHFRWQQMVIVWSLLVFAVLLGLSFFFKTRPSAIKHDPGSPKAFASCEHGVVQQENEFIVMEQAYFFATLAIYIVSTAGSLLFAIHQRRTAHRTTDEVISMGDYAVLATGFPVMSGTRKCEEEIQAFFQKQFPDLEVIGASVCWNIRDKDTREWVEDQNNDDIFELDVQFDARSGDDSRHVRSQNTQLEDKYRRLEVFDTIFGIGEGLLSNAQKAEKTPEQIEAKLGSLETTGSVFIIVGTERQCQQLMERARQSPLLFEESHPIALRQTDFEPETIIWHGFGTSLLILVRNLILGNLAIFTGILILDIFFYAPYVVYIFMYADVKGMVGGDMIQGTLLGLLITVCNQIIYIVIGVIAEKCGFRFLSFQRQFYVVQYLVAVFFNTCVDLWTVMLLAQGFSVQDVASKLQDVGSGGDSGALSPKAIAEQPAVQRSVYMQLLTYLYPGCLLIPFLLEPLVACFLMYLVPKWLVRSRPEVDVAEAERRLAAPDFDLSRYGDILVNVMLCVLALAFTYRDLYQVFAWLAISLLIIYAWDHYRFLRCSRITTFSSSLMEFTSHWLLAVPCAIMAAVLVFHAWAASDDGFLEPVADFWKQTLREIILDNLMRSYLRLAKKTIGWYMVAAFVGHLLVHFAVLFWIVPHQSAVHADHDDMVPYGDTAAASPCTWFNANPVHTLRSKYIYKHNPACVPFAVGKAYLQTENHGIGQHYHAKQSPRTLKQKSTEFGFGGGV